MDYIYLKAKVAPVEYSPIDKEVVATAVIDLVERGASNYSGFKDGARLSKIHVCSIICANQDYNPVDVSELYDEIEAEKKAMASVRIADCSTQTAYVAELDKVSENLDSAKWLAGVKLDAGVTTWTALKELYPTAVAEVVESK